MNTGPGIPPKICGQSGACALGPVAVFLLAGSASGNPLNYFKRWTGAPGANFVSISPSDWLFGLSVTLCLAFVILALVMLVTTLRKRRQLTRQRKRSASYFEQLLGLADRIEVANDTESLAELLRLMASTQRRAETEWLAGYLRDDDLHLFYATCQIRVAAATDKITKLQLQSLRQQAARIYTLMANHLRQQREAAEKAAAKASASAQLPPPPAKGAPAPAPKAGPAKVTAKVEEIEESLPDIVLPPEEGK